MHGVDREARTSSRFFFSRVVRGDSLGRLLGRKRRCRPLQGPPLLRRKLQFVFGQGGVLEHLPCPTLEARWTQGLQKRTAKRCAWDSEPGTVRTKLHHGASAHSGLTRYRLTATILFKVPTTGHSARLSVVCPTVAAANPPAVGIVPLFSCKLARARSLLGCACQPKARCQATQGGQRVVPKNASRH